MCTAPVAVMQFIFSTELSLELSASYIHRGCSNDLKIVRCIKLERERERQTDRQTDRVITITELLTIGIV